MHCCRYHYQHGPHKQQLQLATKVVVIPSTAGGLHGDIKIIRLKTATVAYDSIK
jgi:hypothetical protein